jgi:hypothetical protein
LDGDTIPAMAGQALRCAFLLLILSCGLPGVAQTELSLVREVKIIPAASGRFPPDFFGESGARLFSMRLAPDQSVLILNPTPDGQWALLRVRNWWTADPQSDLLRVPGWSSRDTQNSGDLGIEVQVTPDGHYAVAIAGADWEEKPLFAFAHPGYVQRKPDAIITVVDLERWQIVRTLHTASLTDADFRGARVLSNGWLGLQGLTFHASSLESLDERHNLLISIPDLTPGPACLSHRADLDVEESKSATAVLGQRNDAACAELLKAAGEPTVNSLEYRIYEGNDAAPLELRARTITQDLIDSTRGNRPLERLVDDRETLNWDYWNSNRDWLDVFNPPYESPSGHWYLLPSLNGPFLCDNPAGQGRHSACGCRIHDVSEERQTLLAYCRTQHGDFDGGYQHQWLTVLRSDDFSGIGVINLSKERETLEAIGIAEGRAYVLVIESGASLRIYSIP